MRNLKCFKFLTFSGYVSQNSRTATPAILANLPNIELTILIGQYAQKYYLPENNLNVTETVHHFRDFLPQFLPLVHPSPRNQIWLKKNPWFEQEIVPTLQKQVKAILSR